MNATAAKRMVVLAVVGSGTLAAVGQLAEGDRPEVRTVVGGFLAATFLGFIAEFAPTLAGSLAALMLTTAALVLGGPAWSALASLTQE